MNSALSWVDEAQKQWELSHCQHKPGMWRRDLSVQGLHSRCVTECRECGAVMRGTWTAWGTITKIISVELKGSKR